MDRMDKWLVTLFFIYVAFMTFGSVYFYNTTILIGAIIGVLLFVAIGLFHYTNDRKYKNKKKIEG